jgi:hypothetical protein
MKLCKDSDHPGWIKRKRNRIFETPEVTPRRIPEKENLDDLLSDIGNVFDTEGGASDCLMHHSSSTSLSTSPGKSPQEQKTVTRPRRTP